MYIRKLHLRTLLISLSIGAVLLTSALLLIALMFFQKSNIENTLLNVNIAYAKKLADTTDRYLDTAQQELAWTATLINNINDVIMLRNEADRLRLQSGFFNSVIVVNDNAVVAATSPESLNLVGIKLNSLTSLKAISTKKPFISDPYVGASGNYVIFISQPLFSKEKEYIGYIGGSIYLKTKSMLSDILSRHFYGDDTDVSIVDSDGSIIYNHNLSLIGTTISLTDEARKTIETSQSGHFKLITNGKGYLIGFSSIQKTHWKIFITGSSDSVSQILRSTALNATWFIIIIITISGLSFSLLSTQISRPLSILAELTKYDEKNSGVKIIPDINAWYQEAELLKDVVFNNIILMSNKMNILTSEANTDALTGLYNRRGFNKEIQKHLVKNNNCLIAIDIDYFKKINDSHGHKSGDLVLISVANAIKSSCKSKDIIGRFGGEEFTIFLPDTNLNEAAVIAERVRFTIANTNFPIVGQVTISGGVVSLEHFVNDFDIALREADIALYEAKGAGRNVIIINKKGLLSRFGE